MKLKNLTKLHWIKPDGIWWILIQPITYLPVKLGCILKQNCLMSSNFFFTYRQAVHMPIVALFCLLSTHSDPVWITATDSPHVNTASGAWLGFRFIPCPSQISPSWLGAADLWWLVEHRGSARILMPATDAWTDTRSPHPHWHDPPSGHLAPAEQAPVNSHLAPACETALHWDHRNWLHSSCLHLFTSLTTIE